MAIRRKDITTVLGEESHLTDEDMTKLLNLIHGELDSIRDEKDTISDQLKKAMADLDGAKLEADNAAKGKADAEKALTDYQAEQAAAAERNAHTAAYRSLLASAGVGEKHIDSIMKVTDIGSMAWNKDGSVRDSDKVLEGIKTEWADFIPATKTAPVAVETPPQNTAGGAKMSRDEIMAIKDRVERRAAIAANPEAFARKES